MATRRNVQSERKHLTADEMDALIAAAGAGRHGARDRAMCEMMFRHGLRVSELIEMKKSALDLEARSVWVARKKGSLSTRQPLQGETMRALRRWLREREKRRVRAPELFVSERGDPFTRFGLNYLVKAWGERAGLPFKVHPHMLRHSCGFALVNREGGSRDLRMLQDYLGHRDPRHTAQYTALASGRFDDLWGKA